MSTNKVQFLYNICSDIFCHKQQLPTFQQLRCLKNHLDEMKAVDVGIEEYLEDAECPILSPRGLINSKGVSEITYIHIHECDFFSIGIFCLPEGGELPLHDHPGMMVMSKLLYGCVHVKAYDWIKMQSTSSGRTFGLGKKVIDRVWSARNEPRALFPRSGGNIHSFRAISACAILDVLSPPYCEELGRPSTYFSDFPIPTLPDCSMLEEMKQPDDLYVVGAPYLGSSIVTKGDRTYAHHQYF